MKTLMIASLTLSLAFATAPLMAASKDKDDSGPPGQKKKEGWVPPGLEKKGGLPPGQAKKQQKNQKDGDSDGDDTKSPSTPPTTATDNPVAVDATKPPETKSDQTPGVKVPPPPPPKDDASRPPATTDTTATKTTKDPTVTPPALDPVQARAKLEQQVKSLNRLDNNRTAAAAGWKYVTERTGVPQATIQQQRKAFPFISPAGALCGNLISKQTGVPYNKVAAERTKGREWGVLADQYKVPVTSLLDAVSGLETAMVDAAPAAKTGDTTATKTTKEPAVISPTVDPAQAKAKLEQQVKSLNQLDNNRTAAAAGWKYVTERTGVPQATIQQQRKAFPFISPAGALCGNLIAKQAGVPYNKLAAERTKGREWGALAEQHKVPVDTLLQAVSALEKSMQDAASASAAK